MLNFKFKNSFVIYTILLAMSLMIFKSSEVLTSVRKSLIICFSSVIPSLFPFMVLSSAFVGNVSASSFKFVRKISRRLFGISAFATAAFICGMICGYPIGAKCTRELYDQKKITASEAESLIAYSNNSGPLFVIGAIGIGMFNSVKGGILLYIIQLISALTAAMLLKCHTERKINPARTSYSVGKDLTASICDSVTNVLNVCGFIVFFSVVNTLLKPITSSLPKLLQCFVSSVIEITNAAGIINTNIHSLNTKLCITSFALGWSGLSVHMQVKSILRGSGLSMRKYYFTRVFMGVLSFFLAYLFTNCTDDISLILCSNTIPVFAILMSFFMLLIIIIRKKERRPTISANLPSCDINLKYKH